jgi:hypothetical protein
MPAGRTDCCIPTCVGTADLENECWDLPDRRLQAHAVLTDWGDWRSRGGHFLTFTLYQSPDARHVVRALLVGDTLRGTGESSGAGIVEVHWHRDTIIAVRVGPPDITPCVEGTAMARKGQKKGS